LQFVYGEAIHTLHVEQHGAGIQGTYRTPYTQTPLSGQVSGDQVRLRARYQLTGRVQGNRMEGTAHVGHEWPATWSAERQG
jgi:hypothetical protein